MQLLGLNTKELEDAIAAAGQPRFRGRQIAAWLYKKGAHSFDAMTDLSRGLREALARDHEITYPTVAARYDSGDGSSKLLLEMADGERIETVRLPYHDRLSVCVSSQAGCAMACSFCATGLGGFRRNLTAAEIISQPLLAMQNAGARPEAASNESARNNGGHNGSAKPGGFPAAPSHIVFMGMGEPLLNVNNVLRSIHLMHDEMGISMRHITVSTVGIIKGIERLAEEDIPVTLAVSLHAPDDDLRHRLIPTSTKTSVNEIVAAARAYLGATGRRVTFEYVLLGGVNDSPQLARKLVGLCRGWPCHVNIIPWNAVPDAKLEEVAFHAPTEEARREFKDILERAGIAVTQRVQRGADVAAACGQLRALDQDRRQTIELVG